MTKVYSPNRCTKLQTVSLSHTMSLGRRYDCNRRLSFHLEKQIDQDKIILARSDKFVKRLLADTCVTSVTLFFPYAVKPDVLDLSCGYHRIPMV